MRLKRVLVCVQCGRTPAHCLAKSEALTTELMEMALGSELLQAAWALRTTAHSRKTEVCARVACCAVLMPVRVNSM